VEPVFGPVADVVEAGDARRVAEVKEKISNFIKDLHFFALRTNLVGSK